VSVEALFYRIIVCRVRQAFLFMRAFCLPVTRNEIPRMKPASSDGGGESAAGGGGGGRGAKA